MDIELETIGPSLYAKVERRERVFRTERAAAAVREHERSPVVKERHLPLE